MAANTTLSPTKLIDAWAVSDAVISNFTTFEETVTLQYDVGAKADNVVFELMNAGCEALEPDFVADASAVNMFDGTFSTGSASVQIEFFTSRFNSDTGGFVTFSDATMSAGTVDFCIRATSYEENIDVTYRETEFTVTYDNMFNFFQVTSFDIVIDEASTFIDVIDGFEVTACQCEEFICSTSAVGQNDKFVMCIIPEHDDIAIEDAVRISNFDLLVEAGVEGFSNYTSSNPVSFGTDTWDANSLTVVTEDPSGTGCVQVSTVMIAKFFLQNFEIVMASGNAFLEFIPADFMPSDSGRQSFREYATIIGLDYTVNAGCLASLVRGMTGFF